MREKQEMQRPSREREKRKKKQRRKKHHTQLPRPLPKKTTLRLLPASVSSIATASMANHALQPPSNNAHSSFNTIMPLILIITPPMRLLEASCTIFHKINTTKQLIKDKISLSNNYPSSSTIGEYYHFFETSNKSILCWILLHKISISPLLKQYKKANPLSRCSSDDLTTPHPI